MTAAVSSRWFVVFCDPEPPKGPQPRRNRLLLWLLGRLRPGFRHCYAVRPLELGRGWLLFNPMSLGTDVLEIAGDDFARALFARARAHACTVVPVAVRRPGLWAPRLTMTCATQVAHLLGVPSRPWTTPFALYRILQKENRIMGGLFSKPSVDTSSTDAYTAELQKENAETEKKNKAKLTAIRAGQSGRSLLAFSDTGETGVKTTLGAG